MFRWPKGYLEENVFAVTPDAKLDNLIADPLGAATGMRAAKRWPCGPASRQRPLRSLRPQQVRS
jgi:hypothetical protein